MLAISSGTDGEGELDASVVSELVGKNVDRALLLPLSDKMGGLSGDFRSVVLSMPTSPGGGSQQEKMELVLKVTSPGNEERAVALGTPREGLFFGSLARELPDCVPTAYHGYGDMKTGAKQVLMEKLRGVPAGVYFGRANPNNWTNQTQYEDKTVEVTRDAFALYAKLHSTFWLDDETLTTARDWLRGADWYRGQGKQSWETAQSMAADAWKNRRTKGDVEGWDDHLVKCLDASFSKVDWDTFQQEIATKPYTVVHGDCHPHNIIQTEDKKLVLIDFEMVGIGSNAQELGQFMISHVDPEIRRANERMLVKHYYDELLAASSSTGSHTIKEESYSFEECWVEYQRGGAGRWLWFVPYLCEVCPPVMNDFFRDQTAAFLKDHFPDPSTVPMPRV